MANEFIARNGIISKGNLLVTGSLTTSGSLTATGTITATTLVVQTVTSSISSITGSTNFGSLSSNTHTFTGSIYTSGSGIGVGTSTLDTSGNLYTNITVDGATYSRYALQSSGTAKGRFQFDGTNVGLLATATGGKLQLQTAGANNMEFYTNDTLRMTISGSGNVGIGTSSPSYKLDVLGDRIRIKSTSTYGGVIADNTGTTGGGYFGAFRDGTNGSLFGTAGAILGSTSIDTCIYNDAGADILNYTNNVLRTRISNGGTLYYYALANIGTRILNINNAGAIVDGGASDITLKENINPITYGLQSVLNLNPITYEWIDKEERGANTEIGFIAQEVKEIIPELVYAGSEDKLGIDYHKITTVLVKAIQELTARVQELENK